MTPIYNSNSTIPQYCHNSTVHTPLLLPFFSCPPREATLAARDPHFPPVIPFQLFRNIYIIIYMSTKQRFLRAAAQYGGTADVFFVRSSTSFGHQRSSAPTTYIYIYAVISTSSERHGTATFGAARASQVQGPLAMFFLFFTFCFLTVVLNKD